MSDNENDRDWERMTELERQIDVFTVERDQAALEHRTNDYNRNRRAIRTAQQEWLVHWQKRADALQNHAELKLAQWGVK